MDISGDHSKEALSPFQTQLLSSLPPPLPRQSSHPPELPKDTVPNGVG